MESDSDNHQNSTPWIAVLAWPSPARHWAFAAVAVRAEVQLAMLVRSESSQQQRSARKQRSSGHEFSRAYGMFPKECAQNPSRICLGVPSVRLRLAPPSRPSLLHFLDAQEPDRPALSE